MIKLHNTIRIGIVGLSIETMLSSPGVIGMDSLQEYGAKDFRQGEVWMVRGILARLDAEPDALAVPLYWVTALPGGPMTTKAYRAVKTKTLQLIEEQGPFEGILVVNHGALEVEGLDQDADTDFVLAIRQLVGESVPIGVALDLHGDMTPELLNATTVLSILRTAPHRDDKETGYRAADQLLEVLKTGIQPKKAAVRIPILLPGEIAVTTAEPAKALYNSLSSYSTKEGVLEANILTGFAWNDRPWTSATAIVVSKRSAELARAMVLDLAGRIWAERKEFRLQMETAEVNEGLARAANCSEKPVFVSDSGDNTTAGAAGDLTFVLQAALDLKQNGEIVIAGITAPTTVQRLLDAGIGNSIEIELGLEHVSRHKTRRKVTALVEAGGKELHLLGFQPYRSKESAWARVRIGKIIATFHAQAIGITTPNHFSAMGISPTAHKIYVVKLGYLHPQLEDISARHILLLSDGTSQLDMTRLSWARLARPIHPLDQNMTWNPHEGLYGDKA
ncbi:MAG: M81 family metallopeptidase [Verrucomicrobia bacterium]|nr:M81 family metallopeptidase [Verrucomicrobiota bacterium]